MAMLNIQKIILVTSPVVLKDFCNYLKLINANLSLQLINSFDKKKITIEQTEQVCIAVYGNTDEKTKKRFYQLAYHTFNLCSYISSNYPSFLNWNTSRIEHLLNSGKEDEALILAENTLSIAQKIEDRITEISLRKFLSNYYYLNEIPRTSEMYLNGLENVLLAEQEFISMYNFIRCNFNIKSPKTNKKLDINSCELFFNSYRNSSSLGNQIFAEYGSLLSLASFDSKKFYHQSTYQRILLLEKKMLDNSLIVFPFLEDLLFKIRYLKIQYVRDDLSFETILNEVENLQFHIQYVNFWNIIINTPKLFSIAFQASYFTTKYFDSYKHQSHRNKIDNKTRIHIQSLLDKCSKMLENETLKDKFLIKYINLSTIYAGFLILGEKKDILQSLDLMENILFTYQQIPFHRYLDGIFTNIILAYFSLGNYQMVKENYKRFNKLCDEKYISIENKYTLDFIHLVSQWLSTKNKLSLQKIQTLMHEVKPNKNLKSTYILMQDITNYFQISKT
jgi:hypothetical protein